LPIAAKAPASPAKIGPEKKAGNSENTLDRSEKQGTGRAQINSIPSPFSARARFSQITLRLRTRCCTVIAHRA